MKIRDEADANVVRKVRRCLAEAHEETQGGALREVWAELGRRMDAGLQLPEAQADSASSPGIASPIS